MGRHSAPGDDDVDGAGAAPTALDLAPRRGRHASADEDDAPDDQPTQMIAVVDAGTDVDDQHDTDEFAVLDDPAATGVLDEVLTEAPARPSWADRRAAKRAGTAARVAEPEVVRPEPEVADPVASSAGAPVDITKPAKKPRRESDTRADMRLLRHNGAVRARCIAAVVVSFLLYTVVMLVIGRTNVYLLWIWIPIVLSGVLVGTVLDLAHRSSAASAVDTPAELSEPRP